MTFARNASSNDEHLQLADWDSSSTETLQRSVDPSEASGNAAQDLYEALSGSLGLPTRPAILFAWWPESEKWGRTELVRRSTECFPAVRPGLDLLAVPELPEVRKMWNCWVQEHGINPKQALWYDPCLGPASKDPALEASRQVLSELAAVRGLKQPPVVLSSVVLHVGFAPEGFVLAAMSNDVPVVGESQALEDAVSAFERLHSHSGNECGALPNEDTPVGQESLGVNGDWNLDDWSRDFDAAGLSAVVGLGRVGPSWSLASELWASRSVHPVAWSHVSYDSPSHRVPPVDEIMASLRLADLLWDGDDGVMLCQHAPGIASTFVVASSCGPEALQVLTEKLDDAMLEAFGHSKGI